MPLSASDGVPLTRRRVLGGGLLLGMLAFTGCAPESRPTPTGPPSSAPSLPTPTPTPTAVPSAPAVMSRDAAIARFEPKAPGKFGLEVTGVQLGLPDSARAAALTFDACGGANGSGYDAALIESLREYEVPATLFINQRWARTNTSVMRELVGDPLFEIANHGTTHAPLASRGQTAYGIPGTGSIAEAYDEIMLNQRYLFEEFGVQARFFRSGTAHVDELCATLTRELNLIPMNFTVNLDAGATFAASSVEAALSTLGASDVGIGHFNQPGGQTAAGVRAGLPALLERLRERDIELVRLAEIPNF